MDSGDSSPRNRRNHLGDVEITDPKAMRALAHPVRLAILERLQRYGPATATQLSPHVGATPSVASWHLRHLAGFGLVRDAEGSADRRERRWEAVGRGFRFEMPEDEDGVSAARALFWEMFAQVAEVPERWATEVEPVLEPRWRRVAMLANTRIVVSAEELARIEDAMEAVLAPYVTRAAEQRPHGARDVRVLRYLLPEAADEPEADSSGAGGSGADGPGADGSLADGSNADGCAAHGSDAGA
ncbi:ArsR/SmtB family transcription factor [Streptomyces cylindrosporus]|uniref:Helix-turn-helix domain-containing protein n=1 Tax=Streptomyces cylindrosporus TaxID=2927583 RepID=A0ABS9Y2T6_9ACTN|nr:helix-turn-helix domain-containing protein [Streptomyces cylindrosporus]MCI3271509.1 helix-turn-helix domain-containing protein [Streptomyces cylindrosporus]